MKERNRLTVTEFADMVVYRSVAVFVPTAHMFQKNEELNCEETKRRKKKETKRKVNKSGQLFKSRQFKSNDDDIRLTDLFFIYQQNAHELWSIRKKKSNKRDF
ncbi:hypothetical protein KSF78_0000697 [Schistosoma japonicum]|nr:hypothetical protein KSF78_0000697 [Schistosoma japonicum]